MSTQRNRTKSAKTGKRNAMHTHLVALPDDHHDHLLESLIPLIDQMKECLPDDVNEALRLLRRMECIAEQE